SASCGRTASAGGFKSTEKRSADPGGASHTRPSLPRPADWKSVTAYEPSGIDGSTSACVDSHDSTFATAWKFKLPGTVNTRLGTGDCRALDQPLNSAWHRSTERLDPDGLRLVLGRADQRVADVVEQPVHLRLGEVERHPDQARVDARRVVRVGRELAAPRHEA